MQFIDGINANQISLINKIKDQEGKWKLWLSQNGDLCVIGDQQTKVFYRYNSGWV
jgi:hypothetical protein